jgi:sugar lactone lactonase YvrE
MSIFQGGRIAAFTPDGALERVIDMPVSLISSVAFGGPDLDRLYVTTIDPSEFGWPAEEGAGALYVVDGLGVCGTPEPRYGG